MNIRVDENSDGVIDTLVDYAENDENIRAVLMEGSRAFGEVDQYSDYDVVYVTRSSEPYFGGAILPFLVERFGEIAVMQTPDNGAPHDVYTHLVQFANGIRIDLTFNSISFLSRTPLESATVILLDKDERFKGVTKPSDADFWLKRPDATAFGNHCNQFWWCSPYVAKAVARGQMLHALETLNERVRKEYAVMLSFLAGAGNGWERVNPGKHCTNIKHLLPPDETHYYDALLSSFVQANADEISVALDRLMSEYHSLAATVARVLGYVYDHDEAERTIAFVRGRFM